MRLEKCDIPKTPRNYGSNGKTDMLRHFAESKVPAMKVEWEEGEYISTTSAYGSIHNLIRSARLPLKCIIRGSEIFIINLNAQGE